MSRTTRRHGLVWLLATLASTGAATRASALTIAFITTSNGSYNAEETAKRSQFQTWGHTVNALWDGASQGTYDTALASADLVYVSKDATPADVASKLRTATVGVVSEQYQLDDELGVSTSDGGTTTQTQINLVDPAYGSGLIAIFNSSQPETYLIGTIAVGYRTVGETPSAQKALGLIERGSPLANTVSGNSTASGRRLRLPWGGSSFAFSSLSATGLALLQNGLVWAGEKPLLLHWKLDSSSGTSATDSSTYGRTGTVAGTSTWITGRRKNAFDFNGSTKIEATTLLNNPTNFTIACWARIDATDSGGSEGISVGDYLILRVQEGSSGARGTFYAGGSVYRTVGSSTPYATRGWHHFAVTFDDLANTLKLYVDGALVATQSTTSSISWSGLGTKTIAGAHGNGQTTYDLDGALDDVRIYNYPLPQSEIADLYGLVGYWKLTETSGTAATDTSGKSLNGTYTNGPTLAQSGPYPGAGQYAAAFDGTNDCVDVAAATNYTFADGFSVGGWIYLNAYLNNAAMLENGSTTETCALAFSASGQVRISGRSSGGVQSLTSTGTVPLGRWRHVVGTYDGATFKVYIDGQLDSTSNNTFTVSTPSGNMTLGASLQGSDEFLNGRLQDVHLYNRAIGADEVADLFGLIGRWKMDETSGTAASDSSGSANHGSYANTPAVGQAGPYPGVGLYAPSFDGSDDHVVVGNVTNGLSAGFTVAVWARPTAAASWQRFMDFGNGADVDNIYFGRDNATNDFRIAVKDGSLGNTQLVASGGLMESKLWHHYVATCDSSGNGVLYRDGQVVATGALGTPGDVTRTINYIARSNWAGDAYYQGQLQDMRLYNRPISAIEAAELYGLVGYWKFNEGLGTIQADSSGAGNNAANNGGAPSWVSGVYSHGLQFNGTSDDVRTSSPFAPPSVGTVAFWMRPNGTPASIKRILGNGGDWEVRQYTDGIVYLDLCGDNPVSTNFTTVTAPTNSNRWYHVLGTYDSADDSYAVYMNGVLERSGTSVVNMVAQAANHLSFGTRTGTTERFAGALDDIRVYNRKLSPWEIYQVYGLMAWYKLDETSGTTAADSTGRGQDGTFSGSPTLNVSANGAASQGTAVAFTGSNFMQATGLYEKSSSVSAAGWVRLDGTDSAGAEVVSLGDSFYLRLDSGSSGVKASYYNGSTYVTATASQVVLNTGWHHFAAVLDGGSTIKVYVDGVEAASTATSGAISYGLGANTRVASHGNGATNVDLIGRVDDVRAFNRALKSDEVFQLYHGSRISGIKILQWVEAR